MLAQSHTGSTGHTAVATPHPAPAAIRLSALRRLLSKTCNSKVVAVEELDSAATTAATSAASTATGASATDGTDDCSAPVSTGVEHTVDITTPTPTDEVRVQALLYCLFYIYKCSNLLILVLCRHCLPCTALCNALCYCCHCY
jgi:hypothetical protein